jgi:hypothetical protein
LAGTVTAAEPQTVPGSPTPWLTATANPFAGSDATDIGINAIRWAATQGLAHFADDVPDWAKRIEIEGSKQGGQGPVFSILTVQPLYRSEGNADTVFTQLRAARQQRFGTIRETFNGGLGYRRLGFDERVMFGVNGFFDYEMPYNHARASVGAEVRTTVVELNTNVYRGLSGYAIVANMTTERPLSGADIEVGLPLPYLPWARGYAKQFYWQKVDAPDSIVGQTYSLELTPMRYVQLVGGVTRDNTNPTEAFAKVRFSLGFGADGNTAADKLVADKPFEMKSMADHTLDKVRRENTIVVERTTKTGRGITVAVGRSG